MTVHEAPFYWIECDHCDARCPSPHDDVAAWVDRGQAEDYALDGGWRHTDDGRWLCEPCYMEVMP